MKLLTYAWTNATMFEAFVNQNAASIEISRLFCEPK